MGEPRYGGLRQEGQGDPVRYLWQYQYRLELHTGTGGLGEIESLVDFMTRVRKQRYPYIW